jgi:UDP-glucose 4-epimerase
MKILVTGGAGYIGSITATALEEYGHIPIIVDSLLSGPRIFARSRIFYEGDIVDRDLIRKIFQNILRSSVPSIWRLESLCQSR